MRKKLTLKNSFSGFINKIISILFVFLVRHFFAKYLNTEYLGLEGLFANILGLFSLVDLGLGNAISFNLYEPLHNNDRDTISAIMKLYRKLYVLIGTVVFGLALCFAPFIPNILKDSTIPEDNIRLFFLIYALGVAITYLFSYKRTLIFAMQKNYLVLNVDSVAKVILSILQIVVIIKFHNYALYLLLIVTVNFSANVIISKILDKQDQYDTKSDSQLPQSFIKKLKEHVKALAITNIAWQGIASTDNIIISSFVGMIDLAKNTNYSTISSSINSIFTVILGGASASVGDLLVEKKPEKIKKYFDRYCFIYIIVSAYAALGVYFISKPVITLWVGSRLLFNETTVFLIALNIFLTLNFRPLADYQNFTGNFVYYKPYSVIAVFINLVISIVLGRTIGINGVFIGTTATYIFMIVSVINILSRHLFSNRVWDYFRHVLIACIPMIISFLILKVCSKVLSGRPLLDILISFLMVTLIYLFVICIVLWRNEEFKYFRDLVLKIIKTRSIKGL